MQGAISAHKIYAVGSNFDYSTNRG